MLLRCNEQIKPWMQTNLAHYIWALQCEAQRISLHSYFVVRLLYRYRYQNGTIINNKRTSRDWHTLCVFEHQREATKTKVHIAVLSISNIDCCI